jgi:hypothetical protein
MQGSQGILLICLTFHSLVAIESPLLGARPSKRKIGDGNPLKDEHRRKKAKVKSTLPPSTQVIELDSFPTSSTATTAPNAPSASIPPPHESSTSTTISHPVTISSSESRFPSTSDLSVPTSMQGQQTDTCDTAPKKSSSSNPPPTTHGPIQGMLTEL